MKTNNYHFKLIAVMLFCFLFINSYAQKKHFVYFFTDDKQPFSININNVNFSSTDNGHLVISRLKNGKYFFTVNFPKNKFPEQKFVFVIADNDLGFDLKQSPQGDWAIQNIETNDYYAANASDWEKDKQTNDTLNIDKIYVVEKKTETNDTNAQTSTEVSAKDTSTENTETNKTNTTTINVTDKKTIYRTKERSTQLGITAVYIDYTINPTDTIILFIPYEDEKSVTKQTVEEKKEDSSEAVEVTTTRTSTEPKAGDYNSNCVLLATEADYSRSRKMMSFETSDDKMIKAAVKSFTKKCFYVDQIKKLGLLFLADQNKVKFYIAAKPFIYDRLNYASLETELKLSSAIEQFRKTTF